LEIPTGRLQMQTYSSLAEYFQHDKNNEGAEEASATQQVKKSPAGGRDGKDKSEGGHKGGVLRERIAGWSDLIDENNVSQIFRAVYGVLTE
jgi:hypothetical protein